VTTYYLVRWATDEPWDTKPVKVKHRWFPWPTDNVTFGSVIWEGGEEGMNAPTLRHELWHVRQYRTRGWWWVWTHRAEAEAEAHGMEWAAYPIWRQWGRVEQR
jgi:hypothetical protein